MNSKTVLRSWLIVLILGFFLCFAAWQVFIFPVAEKTWGSFMDFLSPHRYEQLQQRLKNESDKQLLKLLQSRDLNMAEAAKVLLAQRSNPKLFNALLKKMNDPSEDVRMRVRGLLFVDPSRAVNFYMQELKTLPKNSSEYRQILAMLVNLKYQPVFPYLMDFSKNDIDDHYASSELLKQFGDLRALSILKRRLTADTSMDQFEKMRVREAIVVLTKSAQNESSAAS